MAKTSTKKSKSTAAAILLFALFAFVALTFVGSAIITSGGGDTRYYFESYDVTMDVGADRKISVTEVMKVRFNGYDSRGIIRDIPSSDEFVENINATCDSSDFSFFSTTHDISGFTSVYLRGDNKVTGQTRTYTLTYDYFIPVGKAGKNAVSLNIIGFGHTVKINNVTATFILPKAPLESNFFSGFSEENSKENPYATVSEPQLLENGKYKVTLSSDSLPFDKVSAGITGAFVFEDGFLSTTNKFGAKAKNYFQADTASYIALGVLLLVFAVVLILFKFREREKQLVPVIGFSAPRGLDPLQLGKYCDGVTDDKDVFSLVYFLADNGYLKIEVKDAEGKDVTFCKTDKKIEESGFAPHVKIFYSALFAKGERVDVKNLGDDFYSKLSKVKESSQANEEIPGGARMFKKSGETRSKLLGLFAGFGAVAAFVIYAGSIIIKHGFYAFIKMQTGVGCIVGLFILAVMYGFSVGFCKSSFKRAWLKMLLIFAIGVAVGAIVNFSFPLPYLAFIFCALLLVLCGFLQNVCVVRSDEYVDLLGEIEGFRMFIETAEKERLEMMIKDDPELFYHILPYAQVLGVSNSWMAKFKSIPPQTPEWLVDSYASSMDPILRMQRNLLVMHIIHNDIQTSYRQYAAQVAAAKVAKYGGSGGGHFHGGGGFGGGGSRGC